MKRLLFSDIHFHTWAYGATVTRDGMNSRLAAQYAAAHEMVEYANEHSIKYAYFLGDLFHTHGQIPTQALWCASNMFRALRANGTYVRSIFGNHDLSNRNGRFNALSFVRHYNDDDAVKKPADPRFASRDADNQITTWYDDLRVMACSFTNDEEVLKRFFDSVYQVKEKVMVLMHQGVAGVPLSSGFLLDERLTPEMIPDNAMAFTGHYHFHRRVSPNLTVVGNLTPLNWNDIDQTKGWVVFDDETSEITQIPQKSAPGFRLVGRDNLECGNSFVRYSDAASSKEQDEIRTALSKNGAITVEFTHETEEDGTAKAFKAASGEETTLAHLLQVYEEEMEPRRKEVGVEIREGRYAAPTL